ncbi:MAG: DUF547 domain-containing protein [Desulfobacterales bacterium]
MRPMRKKILAALSGATFLICAASAAAAPAADLWERWTANDPGSAVRVDHAAWDRFLKAYLINGPDGVTLVRYGQVSVADRTALERYIRRLAQTEVSRLNRNEQKAFWINLYNALTVKVILDHYPVRSIRAIDISPGLFSDGPWGNKLVSVEGQEVSLDDIEHRILRPIWQDARIHYGVNCASIGCPNLPPAAFTAENTDELLEKGAREFVNSPRGARVENGKLTVSSLYVWFQSDFGGTDAGVIDHLKKYARADLRAQLDRVTRISDHRYDWTLNAAPGQ